MTSYTPPYRNRTDAGEQLAHHLTAYAKNPNGLVLGLARGGLPVAAAIAQRLELPLDVLLVRKLGVPGHEELAFGALAGDVRILNQAIIARLGLSPAVIEETTRREQEELARREKGYRGGRQAQALTDRTILLVDDGLATGASMRAAVAIVRQSRPARIVVAVPVAAESSADTIQTVADEFVCPLVVPLHYGIGAWYTDFSQTSDAEVQAILRSSTFSEKSNF